MINQHNLSLIIPKSSGGIEVAYLAFSLHVNLAKFVKLVNFVWAFLSGCMVYMYSNKGVAP